MLCYSIAYYSVANMISLITLCSITLAQDPATGKWSCSATAPQVAHDIYLFV